MGRTTPAKLDREYKWSPETKNFSFQVGNNFNIKPLEMEGSTNPVFTSKILGVLSMSAQAHETRAGRCMARLKRYFTP